MNNKVILSFALMTAFASGAFASGMIYDPAEYSDFSPKTANVSASLPSSTASTTVSVSDKIYDSGKTVESVSVTDSVSVPKTSVSKVSNAKTVVTEEKDSAVSSGTASTSGSNYNNALFEIDSAQVNLRNDLLDLKAKYQEIDTQYVLIKEKRKNLSNEIKAVEKKIKTLETSKNNIRKTML